VSGILGALGENNFFLKRKGRHFIAKTNEQVGAERTRRQRQREREEFRERATGIIRRLLKNQADAGNPETDAILDRIHNWLRHRTGDEAGILLEEIAGVGKARDAAYEILLRANRLDPSLDRFLVMAGIEGNFSSQLQEEAARLAPYVHTAGKTDYQGTPAFTIDDEDTLEVDDALTVVVAGGEITVGIHIADVSAFVHKGDLLDAEAARRSSTIYLPT